MPRTLLLDLDGTLVDTVPDLASALNRLMRSRGLVEFSAREVMSMVGDGVPALVAKAFAARGRTPDERAVADFTTDYEAHAAVESRLFPGVLPTLADLSRQGWALVVCTNKPERAARSLLDAMGLGSLIQAIGAGDSFAVRKPDPAHVLAALALVGGSAHRAVMVGDHRNDVIAAVGAGVRCVFAGWGYGGSAMADGSAAIARDMMEAAAIASGLVPTD